MFDPCLAAPAILDPYFFTITMRFASTRCRTQRRNRLTSQRSKPYPPHTGGTLHRRLQPLYTEKRSVSCSGSLTKAPQNQPHATTFHWVYCYVMSSLMSLTPPFIECIVTWCQVSHHPSLSVLLCDVNKVSHHPSLSVLLCDVKSHTTPHWVYCYVMPSLTPPFIECIVMWGK